LSGLKTVNISKETRRTLYHSRDERHILVHVKFEGRLSIPFRREKRCPRIRFPIIVICPRFILDSVLSRDIGDDENIGVQVALYDITFTLDDHYYRKDVYSVRLSSKAKGIGGMITIISTI
jgi:hypothetical protein